VTSYLAVVAHPDDEALGCGAALAKAVDDGHTAVVLLATRRCDPRGVATWSALVESFQRSCDILGARPVVLDDLLPETDAAPRPDLLHERILPWVEQADVVLTHWPGDVNQVHRGVAAAVEIATRPFRRRRDVSLFEIPTSTDQVFGGDSSRVFAPNEYVVVSAEHARRKCAAFAAYTGETAPGRTPEDVERRLRLRGREIGVEYAEAYVVARRFR
jgi:LmbE family N-acetylglucosaminyl deacetylase